MKRYKVAITGGGTGGHVYPALAVVEKLRETTECDIFWIGSSQGMERDIVEREGITYYSVPTGKLRRYFSLKTIPDMFRIIGGLFSSLRLLRKTRPAVLFSKGGFVSVPPVIAAKLLRIPVISHESDIDPGLATRINMRFSKVLCVPYENYRVGVKNTEIIVTGNPQRQAIFEGDAKRGRDHLGFIDNKPILLVSGGSLGASQINTLIQEILDELLNHFFVVHQMGDSGYIPSNRDGYVSAPYFHEDYGDILAAADFVVCRGGAGSLWEVGLLRKLAVVIPLGTQNSRGDQVRNAELFASRGAIITMGGGAVSSGELLNTLEELLKDRDKQDRMRFASAGLCNIDSADKIVEIIGAYV